MEEYNPENVHKIEKLCVVKEEYKFSETIPKKIDEIIPKYPFYRKIRGDGNCYYRAVMIRYVEKVIALGPAAIQSFINLIESDASFFEFKDKSIIPILKKNLEDIKKIREEKGSISALKYHFQLIRENDDYDLAYIKMLRSSIATFLELNDDLEFNGIALKEVVDPIESFIEDIVLKNGELAQTIVLTVAPLVLRIGINVVIMIDDSETNILKEFYSATHPSLDFTKDDQLNLHENFISVFFYSGHYNAIYSKEDIEQYPELACYNDDNLQCAICHKTKLDMMMANLHNHIAHYSCFMESLEKSGFKSCPICGKKLELKDIKIFARNEDIKAIEKILNEEKAPNEPKKIGPNISTQEEKEKCLINEVKNQPHLIDLKKEERSTSNPLEEEIKKNPERKQNSSDNKKSAHSKGNSDQVQRKEEKILKPEEKKPQRQQPSKVQKQSKTEAKEESTQEKASSSISKDSQQKLIQEGKLRAQIIFFLFNKLRVIIGIHY